MQTVTAFGERNLVPPPEEENLPQPRNSRSAFHMGEHACRKQAYKDAYCPLCNALSPQRKQN